jgi:hypothetical protein
VLNIAATFLFSSGHIALTGLIGGALAAAAALLVRPPPDHPRYQQARAAATVMAFAVNVLTI